MVRRAVGKTLQAGKKGKRLHKLKWFFFAFFGPKSASVSVPARNISGCKFPAGEAGKKRKSLFGGSMPNRGLKMCFGHVLLEWAFFPERSLETDVARYGGCVI